MREEGGSLKQRFRALKDSRAYEKAPKLAPSPLQEEIALEAFERCRDSLPPRLVQKLESRFATEGHYINTVRYYPFPILVDEGSREFSNDLLRWGETYAHILRKVVAAYRQPGLSYIRRFLRLTLLRYFPPHLLALLEQYRTLDDLAGAHLGDDTVGDKTVEWNLGAVGGLDEGFLVAHEIVRSRKAGRKDVPCPLFPIESDAVETIREALHYAYESFCLANEMRPAPRPFIAYAEYDDIYGSTVSICERLKEGGENIKLCFVQELAYRQGRLYTSSGDCVDMVFMDCHLEDLPPGHPLFGAAAANAVALDCSPFAHLVLRSKVIMALLCSRAFLAHLGLTTEEREMLHRHLVPTYLWRRETFRHDGAPFSQPLRALLSDQRLGCSLTRRGKEAGRGDEDLVVKVGIGSVFGGSSVSVVAKGEGGYHTKEAVRVVSKLVSEIAGKHTLLPGHRVQESLRVGVKEKIRSLVSLASCRRLPIQETEAKDPFWEAVASRWQSVLTSAPPSDQSALFVDKIIESLRVPLKVHFDVTIESLKTSDPRLWESLKHDIANSVKHPLGNDKIIKTMSLWSAQLGHSISSYWFRERQGSRALGRLMSDVKEAVGEKEQIEYQGVISRVMTRIESFLKKTFGVPLPTPEKENIAAILLSPFYEKQLSSVNPIVLQPYVSPDRLEGETGLYLSHRVHLLFTPSGPRVFISGTQVFFLKEGKPDNRSKMTGSLWVNCLDLCNR